MKKRSLDSVINETIPKFRSELIDIIKENPNNFEKIITKYEDICYNLYGRFAYEIYKSTIGNKKPNLNLINRITNVIDSYNSRIKSEKNKISISEVDNLVKKISIVSFLTDKPVSVGLVNKIIVPYMKSKLISNDIGEKDRNLIIYNIYNSRNNEVEKIRYKKIETVGGKPLKTNKYIKEINNLILKKKKQEIVDNNNNDNNNYGNISNSKKEIKKTINIVKDKTNVGYEVLKSFGYETIGNILPKIEVLENLDKINDKLREINDDLSESEFYSRLNKNNFNSKYNIDQEFFERDYSKKVYA